jgi:glutathione S-transferase
MIVLNGAGELFGLPEASPYVTKTEVHLKMAGLSYEKRGCHPHQGPKKQMPWIDDGGRLIGDSAFIRLHIEQEYGIDLDAGLSDMERAVALAVELMVDQQLSPILAYFRWMVPANFEKGPSHFFDQAPEHMRESLRADALTGVRANLIARGVAQHSDAEILALALRTLKALDAMIGDKPYLMGDAPVGADAFVFAVLAGVMTPFFETPVRDAALRRPRLVAYVSRMMDRFYPDFEWDAGLDPNIQQAA